MLVTFLESAVDAALPLLGICGALFMGHVQCGRARVVSGVREEPRWDLGVFRLRCHDSSTPKGENGRWEWRASDGLKLGRVGLVKLFGTKERRETTEVGSRPTEGAAGRPLSLHVIIGVQGMDIVRASGAFDLATRGNPTEASIAPNIPESRPRFNKMVPEFRIIVTHPDLNVFRQVR